MVQPNDKIGHKLINHFLSNFCCYSEQLARPNLPVTSVPTVPSWHPGWKPLQVGIGSLREFLQQVVIQHIRFAPSRTGSYRDAECPLGMSFVTTRCVSQLCPRQSYDRYSTLLGTAFLVVTLAGQISRKCVLGLRSCAGSFRSRKVPCERPIKISKHETFCCYHHFQRTQTNSPYFFHVIISIAGEKIVEILKIFWFSLKNLWNRRPAIRAQFCFDSEWRLTIWLAVTDRPFVISVGRM